MVDSRALGKWRIGKESTLKKKLKEPGSLVHGLSRTFLPGGITYWGIETRNILQERTINTGEFPNPTRRSNELFDTVVDIGTLTTGYNLLTSDMPDIAKGLGVGVLLLMRGAAYLHDLYVVNKPGPNEKWDYFLKNK